MDGKKQHAALHELTVALRDQIKAMLATATSEASRRVKTAELFDKFFYKGGVEAGAHCRYPSVHEHVEFCQKLAGEDVKRLCAELRAGALEPLEAYMNDLSAIALQLEARQEASVQLAHYAEKMSGLRQRRKAALDRGETPLPKEEEKYSRNQAKFDTAQQKFDAAHQLVVASMMRAWDYRYAHLEPVFATMMYFEQHMAWHLNDGFARVDISDITEQQRQHVAIRSPDTVKPAQVAVAAPPPPPEPVVEPVQPVKPVIAPMRNAAAPGRRRARPPPVKGLSAPVITVSRSPSPRSAPGQDRPPNKTPPPRPKTPPRGMKPVGRRQAPKLPGRGAILRRRKSSSSVPSTLQSSTGGRGAPPPLPTTPPGESKAAKVVYRRVPPPPPARGRGRGRAGPGRFRPVAPSGPPPGSS